MAQRPPVGADDDFPDEQDPAERNRELEAMLAGTAMPGDPEPGTLVRGVVIQVGRDDVFLDIGAKSEAVLGRAELAADDDEDADIEVSVGDTLEATVVSTKDGIRLSRRLAKSARDKQAIDDAYAAGLPVEGRVAAVRKGGFDIALPGGQSGFCPLSQIDNQRVEDPETWVGRTVELLVVEIGGGKRRNVVVSRRRLLEAQSAKDAEALRERLTEGLILDGTVASLQSYGAFVELGGMQGLVHISEISRSRVGHPSEVVAVGDAVQVKVLRYDLESNKISLSMKELTEDPWSSVSEKVRAGDGLDGKVTRVAEFGAFVEVAPGLEGLLHVSELNQGQRGGDARELAKPGDQVKVKVLSIDEARRRISLGWIDADLPDGGDEVRVGALVDGKVARVEHFGVFVRIGPGVTGLVPNEEMGTQRGTDHTRDFPPGTPMRVEVLVIEEDGRRIRLSRAKVAERAERVEVDRYLTDRGDPAAADGNSLSTLGDAFRKFKKPS